MLRRMKNIILFALLIPAGLFAQNEFDAIHREVEIVDSLVADTAAMDIQAIDADSVLINTYLRFDEGSPTTSTFLGSDATGIAAWDSVRAGDIAGAVSSGGGWVDNGTNITTITATDSVGVGATSTLALFHVTGTFNATGASQFGNTLGVTGVLTLSSTLIAGGDFDMAGFDIDNAGFLIINAATAPAGTEAYIVRDNTNDLTLNVPSGGSLNLATAGTNEVTFSATQMDLTGLNVVNMGTLGVGAITTTGNLAMGANDIGGFDQLQTTDATTLTLSGTSVTVTQMYHALTAEAAQTLDSLVTINGGVAGDLLILRPADTDDIFIDVGGGNIRGLDRTLDDVNDTWTALFDGTNWNELALGGILTGGGEANTASNLGGGLANFDSKSSVDLRFNSFSATDFDLAANLIAIDNATWAQDSELHTRSHAITSTSDHTATNWRLFHSNGAAAVAEIGLGTSGQVLTSNGAASAPSFQAASGGTDIKSGKELNILKDTSVNITFATAFTSTPNVVVTASRDTLKSGTFVITNESTTGFRLSALAGPDTNDVQWIATDAGDP